MKILVTGGTGFIGRELLKLLMTHSLTVLTRNTERAKHQLHHIHSANRITSYNVCYTKLLRPIS